MVRFLSLAAMAAIFAFTNAHATTPAADGTVLGIGAPVLLAQAQPPKPPAAKGPTAKEIAADLRTKCKGQKPGTKVKALNGRDWACFARRPAAKPVAKPAAPAPKADPPKAAAASNPVSQAVAWFEKRVLVGLGRCGPLNGGAGPNGAGAKVCGGKG